MSHELYLQWESYPHLESWRQHTALLLATNERQKVYIWVTNYIYSENQKLIFTSWELPTTMPRSCPESISMSLPLLNVHSSWLNYICTQLVTRIYMLHIRSCQDSISTSLPLVNVCSSWLNCMCTQFVTQLHVQCSHISQHQYVVAAGEFTKVRGSITHVYSSTSPWLHVAVDVAMSLVDSWVVSSWSLCSYHERDITMVQDTWVNEARRDFYSLVRDMYVVITNSRHMSHRNRHASRTQDTWVIETYMSHLNVTNSRHMSWWYHTLKTHESSK